jgi:hypothetical protein
MTIQLGPLYFIGFLTALGGIFGSKGALIGLTVALGIAMGLSFWAHRDPFG